MPTASLSVAYQRFPEEIWASVFELYPNFPVWSLVNRRFHALSSQHRDRVWDDLLARKKRKYPKLSVLTTLLANEFPDFANKSEWLFSKASSLIPKYNLYLEGLRDHISHLVSKPRDRGMSNPDLQIAPWELELLFRLRLRIGIQAEDQDCTNSFYQRSNLRSRNSRFSWFDPSTFADLDDRTYADPTLPLASKFGGCADVPTEWLDLEGATFWRDHILIAQIRLSEVFASIPPKYRQFLPLPEYGMLYLVHNPMEYYLSMEEYHSFFYPHEDPELFTRMDPDTRPIGPLKNRYGGHIRGGGNADCHRITGFAVELMPDTYSESVLPRYRSERFPLKLSRVGDYSPNRHWLLGTEWREYPLEGKLLVHLTSAHSMMWGDCGDISVYLPEEALGKKGFDPSQGIFSIDTS